jgi:hypothetical protein
MILKKSIRDMITPEQVVFVATSDQEGVPHFAVAKGLAVADDERVVFGNWFCFQTLRNVVGRPDIALSLWDSEEERGVQLIGKVEAVVAREMLDGMAPQEEGGRAWFPQTRHELRVRVERVLDLSTGPHRDE